MGRIFRYQAAGIDTGLTVSCFLRRKGFSRQDLIRVKYSGGRVQLNGMDSLMNARLSADDLVCVTLPDEESSPQVIPVRLPLDILYEDEDIVVVNKPAGMPIHPSRENFDNTLANSLVWYYKEKGIPFVFRCSNRLDRDTSGLTLAGKNVISAGILSEMGARREISREYLAICKGDMPFPWGTIDVPIGRKPGSIIERTVDPEHGERAVTHYELVAKRDGYNLVRLKLETGRTHQIRIHMKYLGCPLIGDYLYNPDMERIQRQALHSWKLSFRHAITGREMEFIQPLPEDMKRILK